MGRVPDAIYLDYHATTPVDPEVVEAMIPYFTEHFGNPASRSHAFGWRASEAVEIARNQVSELLHVPSGDIIFTSGATEGLNLAIKGIAESLGTMGRHIVTVATEHPAVRDPLAWLARRGFEVTSLPVQPDGILNPDLLKSSLRKDTIMVIVMWANNETGVIQDMKKIGQLCHDAGIVLISDGTQAVGKIVTHPAEWGVHILSLSAHKMYGPKGIGALYMNQSMLRPKPAALIHGGGHEKGYRSGTLNVPGIVGLGVAAELRRMHLKEDGIRLKALRDQFEQQVITSVEEVYINGNAEERLPSVSNLKVRFVDSQAVMTRFRTSLAISSGSACSSAHPEPSHVLLAMGLSASEAKESFRISLGAPTTAEDINRAAVIFIDALEKERTQSPVWQMFKQGIDMSDGT